MRDDNPFVAQGHTEPRRRRSRRLAGSRPATQL